MKQTFSISQKMLQLFIILFPILITQISLCSMSFFDTMMAGHASPSDLAGVAIGANIWAPVFTGINGILIGAMPIMAQLNGAGRHNQIPFVVIQGIYLALCLAAVVLIVGFFAIAPALTSMHLEPNVHYIAYEFLKAIAIGVIPLFISNVIRCFIDTLGYTRITMLIMICVLPINILLNYLLIFGNCGFPRLGGIGAGYASALTYWCIAIISFAVVTFCPPFKSYGLWQKIFLPASNALHELLKIGLPIGAAIFCESSIFCVVAVFMAEFGTLTIAAHQAANNFASMLYMLPLSISMALTIVVGFETGARRLHDANEYTIIGIGLAIGLALCCAVSLLLCNEQVAALYTEEQDVLELTEQFLIYAAFFQLSDAIAAPIQGVLRGYKDVAITSIVAFISYWIIGLPIGWLLAHYTAYGPFGYWLGFISALAFAAVALLLRLRKVQRHIATS